MQTKPSRGLQFSHANRSALGRITAAGHLKAHPGMSGWRTYGHYALAYVVFGRGIYEDGRDAKQSNPAPRF